MISFLLRIKTEIKKIKIGREGEGGGGRLEARVSKLFYFGSKFKIKYIFMRTNDTEVLNILIPYMINALKLASPQVDKYGV